MGAVSLEVAVMIANLSSASTPAPTSAPFDAKAEFLSLLPLVEKHARIAFRHVRCPATRDENVAEAIGLAWKRFLRLVEAGRRIDGFKMVFVFLVARSVKSGRRVVGAETANDVLSETAQRRRGFTVSSLPTSTAMPYHVRYGEPNGQRRVDVMEERLADNAVTPIPDQAAFRIDFRAWLRTLTSRERKMVRAMMRNERTTDLSREFEVTAGRISQIRGDLKKSWANFCGDEA